MTKIPKKDYIWNYKEQKDKTSNKETFGDKELWKPFKVYVVYKHIYGELKEFDCVITPIIRYSFPHFYRGYNIKLFHKDGTFYFELHNKPLDYLAWLQYSAIHLKGDGTDTMYSHGSDKGVYLKLEDAINNAMPIAKEAKHMGEQTIRKLEKLIEKINGENNI